MCSMQKNQPEIIPLAEYNITDSSKYNANGFVGTPVEYFLIRNYSSADDVEKLIENFVSSKKENSAYYYYYTLVFYKESKRNNEQARKNPRAFFRSQDEDLALEYKWINYGKRFYVNRFKNGRLLNPSGKVIISDSKPVVENN